MFSADSSGIVDVTSQESLSGTYRGVSPMGLFWSMNLEGAEEGGRATFAKKNVTANKVTLEIRSAERVIAATHFERDYLAPALKRAICRCQANQQRTARIPLADYFCRPARRPAIAFPLSSFSVARAVASISTRPR